MNVQGEVLAVLKCFQAANTCTAQSDYTWFSPAFIKLKQNSKFKSSLHHEHEA